MLLNFQSEKYISLKGKESHSKINDLYIRWEKRNIPFLQVNQSFEENQTIKFQVK